MSVDPKVRELAEVFVEDALMDASMREIERGLSLAERAVREARRQSKRDQVIARAAAAMQQAIEDEITSIRRELEEG